MLKSKLPVKTMLLFIIISSFNTNALAQTVRNLESNVRLNEINAQAFRHFKKNYSSVTNEYWSKTKDGFVVKFEDQQIINQVFYDERGAFRYGIKYFEEKDLGKEIRNRVHKEFPGYQIDVVSEINSDDNTIYLMSLKNKTSVKNIMLSDSDLKVIEDIMYAAR